MAILNKEMKPGVKCYVEGYAECGGSRVYVHSNGLIAEDPDDSDVAVDVLVENRGDGESGLVTVPIESCYWISQKTELKVSLK